MLYAVQPVNPDPPTILALHKALFTLEFEADAAAPPPINNGFPELSAIPLQPEPPEALCEEPEPPGVYPTHIVNF